MKGTRDAKIMDMAFGSFLPLTPTGLGGVSSAARHRQPPRGVDATGDAADLKTKSQFKTTNNKMTQFRAAKELKNSCVFISQYSFNI